MSGFPEQLKLFSVGFDILDLINVLKKYNVGCLSSLACIRFYSGKRCDTRLGFEID